MCSSPPLSGDPAGVLGPSLPGLNVSTVGIERVSIWGPCAYPHVIASCGLVGISCVLSTCLLPLWVPRWGPHIPWAKGGLPRHPLPSLSLPNLLSAASSERGELLGHQALLRTNGAFRRAGGTGVCGVGVLETQTVDLN